MVFKAVGGLPLHVICSFLFGTMSLLAKSSSLLADLAENEENQLDDPAEDEQKQLDDQATVADSAEDFQPFCQKLRTLPAISYFSEIPAPKTPPRRDKTNLDPQISMGSTTSFYSCESSVSGQESDDRSEQINTRCSCIGWWRIQRI